MSSYKRNGPLPEIPETPEKPALTDDLAKVQADDELLDELGKGPASTDVVLVRALLAWRRDVDTAPIPCRVDVDTALALVRARSRRSLARRIADAVRRLVGGGR